MVMVRPFLLAIFLFVLGSVARSQGFIVQVASYASQSEAEMAVTNLRGRGVEAAVVKAESGYRVRVGGRFTSDQQATNYAAKLVNEGVVRQYEIQTAAPRNEAVATVAPPAGLIVDGISGHSLPSRASNKPSTTPSTPRTVAGNAPVQPFAKAAPRVYADDVSLDDLAEFSAGVIESRIEKKDDRLLLYVRNRHGRNLFRGTVRLTMKDSGSASPSPWQFMLKPAEEGVYDLNTVVSERGSYWVEVLDERGKTQLIKAASLEPRKAEIARKEEPARNDLTIEKPEVDEDAPPKDYPMRVAGTNNADAPPADENKPNGDGKPAEPSKDVSKENLQAGDVKVIVRKVAESADNVTLEFEIQAPTPLGLISVAMQTSSTTDFKQAIMTTKLGRIPFLVPMSDTNGSFSFELKDESGRVLASGQKSFQDFKKN